MAQILIGINGMFIGQIGNVTGYVRNGKNLIRATHQKTKYKKSAARKIQHDKLKVCSEFIKPSPALDFLIALSLLRTQRAPATTGL